MDNLLSFFSKQAKEEKEQKTDYICSAILEDGSIIEMVYSPAEPETKFAIFKDGEVKYQPKIVLPDGLILKPLSARGNIVKSGLVLFPTEAEEYENDEELIKEIQKFIHKYVQVSPFFEKIATYYVLFTWVYDRFNELPYLRFLGDWGTGKSRGLKTVAVSCYKPIFAGGAITASPIFRIIDTTHGTLTIDEADFKHSENWAEIIKILNCGYEKGSPVLRSEGEKFEPKAFDVYGPKILATRKQFEDQALESRCLTEEMEKKTRDDIPINLPDGFWEEATQIRNKLLMWRFKNLNRITLNPELEDKSIEPRLNQILIPLLSIVEDEKVRNDLKSFARRYNKQLLLDRGMQFEAEVLRAVIKLMGGGNEPTMKEIATELNIADGREDEKYRGKKFTPQYIGHIVRKELHLHPIRGRGGYRVPQTERSKIERLREKFGIGKEFEEKTDGDLQKEADELEEQYPEEFRQPKDRESNGNS